MKLIRTVAFALAATLAGCGSYSGVQPDGPDSYRIVSEAGTGFVSSGKVQNRNYREASAYCAQQGKVVETVRTDSKQSRPLGGFPEASLYFKCVDRAK